MKLIRLLCNGNGISFNGAATCSLRNGLDPPAVAAMAPDARQDQAAAAHTVAA